MKSSAYSFLALCLLVPALLVAIPAGKAQARPDTRQMTCVAAQSMVRRSGAIVMTTGRYTYNRIVTGLGYCESDEELKAAIVPTRDNPRCHIGYYCRPASIFRDGPGPFIFRR